MPAILPLIYETLLLRSKSRVLQKQGFKTLTSKALKVNIVAQGIPFWSLIYNVQINRMPVALLIFPKSRKYTFVFSS